MDYVLRVKSYVDFLSAISRRVSEQDHILYLLGGLSSEYNSFVVFVTSNANSTTLEDVNSLLLSHENRLQQQHTFDEGINIQASIASRQPFRSYNLSQYNSNNRDFRHSNRSNDRLTDSRPPSTNCSTDHGLKPQCQLCGRIVHVGLQCYRCYVPSLQYTSSNAPHAMIQLCVDNNVSVEFFANYFHVKDFTLKKVLHLGHLHKGLYHLLVA
ncbi:uncharacterized protein LOC133824125 [Humulus lupulus]|uniref:uncharacterized protein LOC133824125 n=1 Tax=Humulus lupulus TaxID=3486 RepID=UPI002B415702|nr:uncharacterized protein LOC133824125 [Humulus lupulus]